MFEKQEDLKLLIIYIIKYQSICRVNNVLKKKKNEKLILIYLKMSKYNYLSYKYNNN